MTYSVYLKPRPETISDDGIEGIIDLANLYAGNPKRLEANPGAFFGLTYPTSDALKVIEQLNTRFSTERQSSGLFLFEGLKGSGKSHLLLLIYNLFKYPDIAREWLESNHITCKLPVDALVVVNKFTDRPYDSIWDMIFESLGKKVEKKFTQPGLDEFTAALGDKKLVLILDELEQGIKVIADPALQHQNIAFLQMLSEFSNRSKQITLFASVYSNQDEPGNTLKRVPRCTVQFDNTADQCNVILHRLFENYMGYDRRQVSTIIESYVQLWQQHVAIEAESVKNRFAETFPFSPSLINIILKRIPARGGFQNVRGALAFLGNLVKLTYKTNDIITPADASIEDEDTGVMLKDLDVGGNLIKRARENVDELKSKVPLANRFGSAVLLYTLTGFDANKGASRDELVADLIAPNTDINQFTQTLLNFQKYASYFHSEQERYFFDLEENPEAKVEYKSLQYSDDQARDEIAVIMKSDIFRETTSAVVYSSSDDTKDLLNGMDKSRFRYVLTGKRLTQEERHVLYHGMVYRNLILLLEPKEDNFHALADRDVLKWAKRILAARALSDGTNNTARKNDYDRIARTDHGHIIERIKNAGLVFVHWERYGTMVSEDHVELENLPRECSKDKTLESLGQNYFPMLTIKEHLESRIEYIKEKLVKDIDDEYKKTLGFPIPTSVRAVSNAIRELCKDRAIGILHERGNCCGKNPDLTETEFFNAKITAPFDKPPPPQPPQVCPVCGQKPCVCPTPPPPPPPSVCLKCGQETCVCPKPPTKEVVSVAIPPQPNTGSLREQIALRLQQYEPADVTRATYKVFSEKKNMGDLSTLPNALRGSLSGQGDITVEVSITKTGKFSKAQVESHVEALPHLQDGDYSAEMTVEYERKGD